MIDKNYLLENINENSSFSEIFPCLENIFSEIINGNMWTKEFFLHPLGFYYCRLFENKENQIRLHIWEPNYPIKEDLFIHDHYYNLCSWILCGKILDWSYDVFPSNEESKFTKYVSGYIDNENNRVLKRTDEFQNVLKSSSRTLLRGDKYFISKESYHSNEILFNDSQITATLVFTYDHNNSHSPNVIGSNKNEYYLEDNPTPISESDVKILINKTKTEMYKI